MTATDRLSTASRVVVSACFVVWFVILFGVYDLIAYLSGGTEDHHVATSTTSEITDGETITPPGGESA